MKHFLLQSARSAKRLVQQGMIAASSASGALDIERRRPGIYAFTFHRIGDAPDELGLTMPDALFKALIDELKKYWRPIRASALNAPAALRADGAAPRFLITFDDGYRDNAQRALPILRDADVPAILYVSTAFIETGKAFWYHELHHFCFAAENAVLDLSAVGVGVHSLATPHDRRTTYLRLNRELKSLTMSERDGAIDHARRQVRSSRRYEPQVMLNWDEIRSMSQSVFEIGSHTVNHPILSRESAAVQRTEVAESKRSIERELQRDVVSFAYPNGTAADFSDATVHALRESGYGNAFTTIAGRIDDEADPFRLPRLNVYPEMCADRKLRFDARRFWWHVFRTCNAAAR